MSNKLKEQADKLLTSNSPEEILLRQQKKDAAKQQLLRKAFNFFYANSCSIDIFRNDQLEKYFLSS
jgi:hypothetical protein